jgi:hypothetical protein
MTNAPLVSASDEDLESAAERIPSVWLSRWESALAVGDYRRAEECDRQLRGLGVRVRIAWTERGVQMGGDRHE